MRLIALGSVAVAATVTLFDVSRFCVTAEAAAQRRVVSHRVTVRTVNRSHVVRGTPLRHVQTHGVSKHVRKIDNGSLAKGKSARFVAKSSLKLGKVNLQNLPLQKAVAGTTLLKGRLGVPQNVRPKLTLIHPPGAKFHNRLRPFVQRHWKKAFLWVAIAGIGYITIPELYYDRFLAYVNLNDPDYDDCIDLLSLAALEEEEEETARAHYPRPPNAVYRFTALSAPRQEERQACSFAPFVERKWNRAYVWVLLPQIGDVTVPEDYYDTFIGFAQSDPPNYPKACAVLVEAAAADTVVALGDSEQP